MGRAVETEGVCWFHECLASKAEAEAFKLGLQWGDEAAFFVDSVEPCQHLGGHWDVVFARMDELDEYDRAMEEASYVRGTCPDCGGDVTFHAVDCPELRR